MSYDYMYYNMTWAEFRIRLYAYRRIQKEEWYKVREIAYNALIGSHMNPKKIPRSKEKFMPLEPVKQDEIANVMRDRIKRANEQYLKEKYGES